MEIASAGESYVDASFLAALTETVLACRSVLKYTYVVGYYMPQDAAQRPLFTDLQERLEASTEELQELSELPTEAVIAKRAEINNKVGGWVGGGVHPPRHCVPHAPPQPASSPLHPRRFASRPGSSTTFPSGLRMACRCRRGGESGGAGSLAGR